MDESDKDAGFRKVKTPGIQEIRERLQPLFERHEFARALVQETGGIEISANSNQTMAEPAERSRGIVVSVLRNGVFYEASTALHSLRELDRLIAGLEKSVSAGKMSGAEFSLIPETPDQGDFQSPQGKEIPLSEKIAGAKAMVAEISGMDERVVMAQVKYRCHETTEVYLSREKTLKQNLKRFEGIFAAILQDKESRKSFQIYDGFARQGGWEMMQPPEGLLKKMLEDGARLLNAPRLTPGTYDCIFSPSLAGILAHEAFGHGTEADTMVKNRARGSLFMNKAVASDKVRLYDSPALEGEAASYFFDHEGQRAAVTRIVENGILTQPMTDHRSASILKTGRSPNGRRESYHHKIYTRMTNTYFMPGENSLEEMIASVKDGYLVDRATNGMEDPKGWGIQLEALFAERIRDGRRTGEVFSPVIITGYVPEILESVSMVSDRLEIGGLGMCGKGHKEWVKVTDGGPWLKLRARLA